ncbi:MAG: hypothetical protein ACI9NC_005947 [Verrucomicrobiales bacterium]
MALPLSYSRLQLMFCAGAKSSPEGCCSQAKFALSASGSLVFGVSGERIRSDRAPARFSSPV